MSFDAGLEVAALALVVGVHLVEHAPLGRLLIRVRLSRSSCRGRAQWPSCRAFTSQDFFGIALAFGLVPVPGMVGPTTWLLVDEELVVRDLGFASTGTPVGESE
jgi:hypothetical protein